MDDLSHELRAAGMPFIERAICRELNAMLMAARPAGKLQMAVDAWAREWELPPEQLWSAIGALEKCGYWLVDYSNIEPLLICESISQAAKGIARKQTTRMHSRLKEKTVQDHVETLDLVKVGKSVVQEVTLIIPRAERKPFMEGGYPGWLPCENFSIDGIAFKPDDGLLQALRTEFPSVDIEAALALMFSELRHNARPKIRMMHLWIRNWLKESGSKAQVQASEEDHMAALLDLIENR
ncbi:hypothetical protein HNP46_000157 [Pseudomonas nitritireducens]|uniref:Uncharacterized protein n=1 Tax=Pseudomonas nitroreducens TaxID=46680 RepID=A0A7W7KFA7_PSENT|nr:hypothetical protein [Pseudomonas nitritireducens]MBB4861346.1 hypothetical protein [Pseudomonas nitritireducens]